jgi:hypothetical protein
VADFREPDYSEFSTTPTGWQERQLADWQTVAPLETEDAQHPTRRPVDLVALIPGVIFVILAVTLMVGGDVPFFFEDGGLAAVLLIGGGAALLVSELRRARRRGTTG